MSWPYQVLGHYLDCPIIGIQRTPQGGEGEPASIREMAKNYADRIQRIHPTGPTTFSAGLSAASSPTRSRSSFDGADAQLDVSSSSTPNRPTATFHYRITPSARKTF
ncbi:putative non-ribosomal peptide synthetase [Mycobacterium xenopi 4042]|uniref:Putative non-ribosomal peptide synthetase n=1 Tax=Mycobacterium xenopi 4042 TaxID=1299334 RepID=X8DBB0_MYCXE|nr:putative non-ribosomal peptide synthetase [Mycobacterium xenopi 4042]